MLFNMKNKDIIVSTNNLVSIVNGFGIVIWGTGSYGKYVLTLLEQSCALDKVMCFCDGTLSENDERIFFDKKVLSPQKAASLFPDSLFVIASSFINEIINYIKSNEELNFIRYIYAQKGCEIENLCFQLSSLSPISDYFSPYHKCSFPGYTAVDKNTYCSGCSACASICKRSAITMVEDENGFIKPSIDKTLCNDCSLCLKVCPIINFAKKDMIRDSFSDTQSCFAYASNNLIRETSSSGGAFFVLASYILSNGGIVCGASYDEDKISVKHIIVEDKQELKQLSGSKYVQSSMNDCFIKIKQFLDKEKTVLFSGTSCQVDGLKKFLKKDYERLLTVDFICTGVPSRKVYRKYVKECDLRMNHSLKHINFRPKDNGWYTRSIKLESENQSVLISNRDSSYMQAFFKGISTNKLCQICPYATLNKPSDITLGDFWGIGSFASSLDDDKGTSVIIPNTKKGKKIVNIFRENSTFFKETPIDWIYGANLNIKKPISHHNRDQFFMNLDMMGLDENYTSCLSDKADCIIYNNCITDINYGSVLTGFAIQQLFLGRGIVAKLLNTNRVQYKDYIHSFAHNFARDYLLLTDPCNTDEEFLELNKKTNCFIVGSDQMWASKYLNLYRTLFCFTRDSKKRIAFACSFGSKSVGELSDKDKELFGKQLPKFDYISVRERSGASICKDGFNCHADWMLDPVFLIDPSVYYNLARKSKRDFSNELVYYGWFYSKCEKDLYEISNIYGCNGVENITLKNYSIEDWLNAILLAKLVISDSFHGICFAIIFNKPFFYIGDIGPDRICSLSTLLDFKDNIVNSSSDIIQKDVSCSIPNYRAINISLEYEKQKCLEIVDNKIIPIIKSTVRNI